MRRELITWNEVHQLIDHLMVQFDYEFQAMLMITRGGIIPGGMLAEAMNITHILTAAVDFPAQVETDESKLLVLVPQGDLIGCFPSDIRSPHLPR